VGQGFDAHRLAAGRPLVLGGVAIPSPRGLLGHSDGDVLLHAVADAILGALGEGDLGRVFGAADPALAGVASGELLRRVLERMRAARLRVSNLDATLIAEAPRLAPWQEAMRKALAERVGARASDVNVKLKSADGLGALGRAEGIAALAVVLLAPARPERAGAGAAAGGASRPRAARSRGGAAGPAGRGRRGRR
jgi:2-C-methyl-D-erythritol 2,4-cyclodiphosphate synthase